MAKKPEPPKPISWEIYLAVGVAKKHGLNRSTAIVWMVQHGLDSVGET
jgi:hypothetical protein